MSCPDLVTAQQMWQLILSAVVQGRNLGIKTVPSLISQSLISGAEASGLFQIHLNCPNSLPVNKSAI